MQHVRASTNSGRINLRFIFYLATLGNQRIFPRMKTQNILPCCRFLVLIARIIKKTASFPTLGLYPVQSFPNSYARKLPNKYPEDGFLNNFSYFYYCGYSIAVTFPYWNYCGQVNSEHLPPFITAQNTKQNPLMVVYYDF